MSYFPCDIPFMSDEELEKNGIYHENGDAKKEDMHCIIGKFISTYGVETFMKILADVLAEHNATK